MLKKAFIISVPVLFVVGSAFHFMYEGSGNSIFIGLIAPIDESVMEHTKLVFLPIILWWLFVYLENIDFTEKNSWFTGSLVSVLSSIISIPVIYYSYTFITGQNYLLADIFILAVALVIGQFLGKYAYDKRIKISLRFILLIYLIFFLSFSIATMLKLTH